MRTVEGFEGKVAIVTGATSGMGRQVAIDLASRGVRVIASGRNNEAGLELIKEGGRHLDFIAGDVKEPSANSALVKRAMDAYGQLDYVVIAAGQLGIGKMDEVDADTWLNTFATNVHAVYYLLNKAIPAMSSNGGSIVLVGSVAAHHAFPNHPAYCASKGALVSLVRQVALDYGPSIRINLVSPAQVRTPMLEDSAKAFPNPEAILQETADRLPMRRLGTTEDISKAIIHLLSEDSSWVTGSNFVIDGGFLTL